MMKKMMAALVLVLCMLVSCAMAEGPRLMVELPDDALMIESFEFDDGDFVQTYQLPEGVRVQMLRYASFDMTLKELAEGEWTGYSEAQRLELGEISGYPAQAMRLTDEQESVIVYTMMVNAEEQTLIFQVVFPKELGEDRIGEEINVFIGTMQVSNTESEEVG